MGRAFELAVGIHRGCAGEAKRGRRREIGAVDRGLDGAHGIAAGLGLRVGNPGDVDRRLAATTREAQRAETMPAPPAAAPAPAQDTAAFAARLVGTWEAQGYDSGATRPQPSAYAPAALSNQSQAVFTRQVSSLGSLSRDRA